MLAHHYDDDPTLGERLLFTGVGTFDWCCSGLGHCHRHWPSTEATLLTRLLRHGYNVGSMLGQCWASVADGGPTLTQHCIRVSCLLGNRHCGNIRNVNTRVFTLNFFNNQRGKLVRLHVFRTISCKMLPTLGIRKD